MSNSYPILVPRHGLERAVFAAIHEYLRPIPDSRDQIDFKSCVDMPRPVTRYGKRPYRGKMGDIGEEGFCNIYLEEYRQRAAAADCFADAICRVVGQSFNVWEILDQCMEQPWNQILKCTVSDLIDLYLGMFVSGGRWDSADDKALHVRLESVLRPIAKDQWMEADLADDRVFCRADLEAVARCFYGAVELILYYLHKLTLTSVRYQTAAVYKTLLEIKH